MSHSRIREFSQSPDTFTTLFINLLNKMLLNSINDIIALSACGGSFLAAVQNSPLALTKDVID